MIGTIGDDRLVVLNWDIYGHDQVGYNNLDGFRQIVKRLNNQQKPESIYNIGGTS